MLGKQDVLNRIRAGEISISYAFDPTGAGPTVVDTNQATVDPNSSTCTATKVFNSFFFGDRLGITMGPIVLSHTYKKKRGRVLYKGHHGCFDLRETAGSISLTPGETFTFHSIEHISVGPNIAAIVLPRLSLVTSGVIVAASYIDPYWDGVLQLHLTNQSNTAFDLRFGERLAICRFYEVSGPPAPDSERKRFAQKSHHFAMNWERILSSDEYPYPLRKLPVSQPTVRSRVTGLVTRVNSVWPQLVGGTLVAALAVGLVGYGRLQAKLDQALQASAVANDSQRRIDRLTERIDSLAGNQPVLGRITIDFPPGEVQKTEDIGLPVGFQPDGVVLLSSSNADRVALQGVVRSDPGADAPRLILTAVKNSLGDDINRVTVDYVVG